MSMAPNRLMAASAYRSTSASRVTSAWTVSTSPPAFSAAAALWASAAGTEDVFARIIARAPEFAEGWNKRATVRYIAENYEGSIDDCEETLRRNPNHFGALSGQGLCYIAIGRHREAAVMFRRALVVHPRLRGARHNLGVAMGEAVRGNGH